MEVVVFVGLQASGKSSFYRSRFAETHTLVSKDLFPSARHKGRRQAREITHALSQGRPVVVDNTNARVEERVEIISLARELGAVVHGYYFESKVSDCLARNATRVGKARIPDVGLLATAKALVLPRPTEGFDVLWYVKLDPASGFVVSAWEQP